MKKLIVLCLFVLMDAAIVYGQIADSRNFELIRRSLNDHYERAGKIKQTTNNSNAGSGTILPA